MDCFVKILMVYLNSRSALQKTVTSLVISAWPNPEDAVKQYNAQSSSVPNGNSQALSGTGGACDSYLLLGKKLIDCLNEVIYFDEIAVAFTRLQSECRDFVATLKHYKVPLPKEVEAVTAASVFSFDQVKILSGEAMQNIIQQQVRKSKTSETLLERRKTIWNLWSQTTSEFQALNTM